MNHLFLCREYPPAPYPAGGIGTYVWHMTRLLAEAGETVHLIGQRWEGASARTERQCDGRLILHRVAAEDTELYPSLMTPQVALREVRAMQASPFPAQWFSWVAAGLAERLIETEGIDIIEGQEWEAPLYYLMLRRSLGLGPDRKPPIIVHLHSPTEFIFRSNDWTPARPDYLPMKRLEDHVILGADALLCPSRFLSAQACVKYGLDDDAVTTIPLPLGDTQVIEREPGTWESGSICYLGRLEPRKGVIEFVDAAIEVAHERPHPYFHFIGADTPFTEGLSVHQYVQQRIPESLRGRFVFHGPRPRAELLSMLAAARIAVVPSRWENFPNTALEAMCTGLPVLATRNGGMAQMIEDDVCGWLAEDSSRPLASRLADALRRALDTPPGQLRLMGARASASIRSLCDNQAILARHLAFRERCVTAGAARSLAPPGNLPWSEQAGRPVAVPGSRSSAALQPSGPQPPSDFRSPSGTLLAVVIALAGEDPAPAFESLRAQQLPHSTLLIAASAEADSDVAVLSYHGSSSAVARRIALDSAAAAAATAILFLGARTRLEPGALALLAAALEHRPEAGMVVPWIGIGAGARPGARAGARPGASSEETPGVSSTLLGETPAFPYQWLADETGWTCLYRTAAVADALALDPQAADPWDLGTAIMAAGWSALRLPALLASDDLKPAVAGDIAWSRRSLAERHANLIARDVATLVSLAPVVTPAFDKAELKREQVETLTAVFDRPLREKLALARAAAREPRRSLRWLVWRLRDGLSQYRSRGRS